MSQIIQSLSQILDVPGAPKARGVCFSCDAASDLSVAEEIARKVGPAATWYSVGILSSNADLSLLFGDFCKRFGLRPLFHPVDLDLCGTDPLDDGQLRALAARAEEMGAPWLNADLAMWCRGGEALLESLIPMPLVPEAVAWTVDRVKHAQDVLQRPIAIENAPYPWYMGGGDILQMMSSIAEQADCLMTVDIGHLYGLRVHQGRALVQPGDDDIAWDRVVESHMSGTFFRRYPGEVTIVDDKHDWPVAPEVWALAQKLLPRARNLRAVMAEAEGLDAERVASTVLQFSRGIHQLWGRS
jgi:uncharacterized protein (UPF0276 family)